jgi:hypothetical protein
MKKALVALAILLAGAAVGAGVALLVVDGDDSAAPVGTSSTTEPAGTGTGSTGTGCNHASTEGCVPGAEIVVDDGEWLCDRPLERYARELGGSLPLKVTARFTKPMETVAGTIDLTTGCRGDGTDAIDLIIDIQGDGRTVGGLGDALVVKLDAKDIDLTGNVDCGPRGPGAHQDGVQAHGASNIAFVDLEVGDWDEQRATCAAASGGIDISRGGAPTSVVPRDYQCIRCRVVACRRAINVGESTGVVVTNGRFRAGNPGELEEELATGEVGLCNFQVSVCNVDATARDSVFEGNVCDEHPYGDARRR